MKAVRSTISYEPPYCCGHKKQLSKICKHFDTEHTYNLLLIYLYVDIMYINVCFTDKSSDLNFRMYQKNTAIKLYSIRLSQIVFVSNICIPCNMKV